MSNSPVSKTKKAGALPKTGTDVKESSYPLAGLGAIGIGLLGLKDKLRRKKRKTKDTIDDFFDQNE
ncbi:hypothetical protein RV10_GL004902 [Enterococcus pallens]|nr:hypothetical protein RV10_GL004902 [Enterococcus pallens]